MHLVFPHVTCVEVYWKNMEYLSFILFIWSHQWQPGDGKTISCTILISFIMEMLCTKKNHEITSCIRYISIENDCISITYYVLYNQRKSNMLGLCKYNSRLNKIIVESYSRKWCSYFDMRLILWRLPLWASKTNAMCEFVIFQISK